MSGRRPPRLLLLLRPPRTRSHRILHCLCIWLLCGTEARAEDRQDLGGGPLNVVDLARQEIGENPLTAVAVVGAGAVALGLAEAVTYGNQNTNTNNIQANANQITTNSNNVQTVCNFVTSVGSITQIANVAALGVDSASYNSLVVAYNTIVNAAQTCTSSTGRRKRRWASKTGISHLK